MVHGKAAFTGPNGVAESTNKLFEEAGVKARVSFKNFDADLAPGTESCKVESDCPSALTCRAGKCGERPREYGDVRYSFVVPAHSPFVVEVESCGPGSSPLPYALQVGDGASPAIAPPSASVKGSGTQRASASAKARR